MRHPDHFKANLALVILALIILWVVRLHTRNLVAVPYPRFVCVVIIGCVSALGLRSERRWMHGLACVANGLLVLLAGSAAGRALQAGEVPFINGPLLLVGLSNLVAFWGLLFVDDDTWLRNGRRVVAHQWTFITNVCVAFWSVTFMLGRMASPVLFGLAAFGVLNALALLLPNSKAFARPVALLNVAGLIAAIAMVLASYLEVELPGKGDQMVTKSICLAALTGINLAALGSILRGGRRRGVIAPESGSNTATPHESVRSLLPPP